MKTNDIQNIKELDLKLINELNNKTCIIFKNNNTDNNKIIEICTNINIIDKVYIGTRLAEPHVLIYFNDDIDLQNTILKYLQEDLNIHHFYLIKNNDVKEFRSKETYVVHKYDGVVFYTDTLSDYIKGKRKSLKILVSK